MRLIYFGDPKPRKKKHYLYFGYIPRFLANAEVVEGCPNIDETALMGGQH
jgi:hypothetical protein